MKENDEEKKTESEKEVKNAKALGRVEMKNLSSPRLLKRLWVSPTEVKACFSQEVHQPSAPRRRSSSPAGHRLPGGSRSRSRR